MVEKFQVDESLIKEVASLREIKVDISNDEDKAQSDDEDNGLFFEP